MNKFSPIIDIDTNERFALLIIKSDGVQALAISESSAEWATWVNENCKSLEDVQESLSYNLQTELPLPLNERSSEQLKSLVNCDVFEEISNLISYSDIQLVDAVDGHGRRYAVKSMGEFQSSESPTTLPLRSVAPNSRQAVINYKALAFRADNTFSEVAFEMKRARALWDPDLGPSGGWRCPPGTQYGGYITDRFGRGCGGGALRRVGRALINAGRGIDKLGARRDARRLNRAVERAQRGETRRERVGAAARRGVAAVSNALERGAQRLVGEYQPRDYDPRTGRMRRRGVDAPEISRERRNAINSRLIEIRDELDDLADKPRNPANVRRENELIEENRRLRRERDGASPKRVSRVRQAPAQRRVIAPAAGQRRPRQQGARPVRKPVAERGRENRRERLARRLVGEFRPEEYKPGDKKRIKNRKNRYADVSDAQLRRALSNNSPKRARPGEARDVEARRRQERLEILQEMLNRGMEIPDQYKREVRQYRLKPQRQRRGDGLNRVGRAAVGLERAAQRVEGERRPRTARNRREQGVAPARPNAVEMQKRRIERARKNRPDGVSDNDWRDYEEYLDNIPDGNFIPEEGTPRLEPVLSYNSWEKRIKPNLEREAMPQSNRRRGQLDGLTDDEITERLLKYRQGGKEPFDMAALSDNEVARLQAIVDRGYVNGPFRDRQRNGRMSMHPAARLVGGEYNMRLDDGRFESNRPTPRPRTATPSAPMPPSRERRRQAVTTRGTESSLRRPMPKRFQGDAFDMDALNRDQKIRMRNLLKDEKAKLDAEWRKRLGLSSDQEITDKAIKAYIKERENNKPGAYIGTLKAKANDWKVLSEWQKKVDDRPVGANLIGENDALNRIGPKRRNEVIKNFNAGLVPFSRSERQRTDGGKPTPRLIPPARPESVDAQRVSRYIDQTINEPIEGSMPDDRSRRNVRNRFPNNGLPETAFWRDADWVGRNENDRAEHERRFGRYYSSDGKLNARGRLVNRQLREERQQADAVEQQISRDARSAARSGKRTSSARPDNDAPKSPSSALRVLEAMPETEAFKKVDARLKQDEINLRNKYDAISDPGELADAIRRYNAEWKNIDETMGFMVNNGQLDGVNAQIYAENLAYFAHSERMRDYLLERLKAVDSERARRIQRELDGIKPSSPVPASVKTRPGIFTRLGDDFAKAEKRMKDPQFDVFRNTQAYKDAMDKWDAFHAERIKDAEFELNNGLRLSAEQQLARALADVKSYNEIPVPGMGPGYVAVLDAKIKHVKDLQALLDNAPESPRRTRSRGRGAPTPQNQANVPSPNSPANVTKTLVVAEPRKRDPRVPVIGEDGTADDPMPVGKVIVNPKIKSQQDAIKWLDDGKPLSEVPQKYWWQALMAHTSGNAANKQYKQVGKNGGAVGDVRIFIALGPDGKPTGQGIVLKADRDEPENNVNEVVGFLLAHAAGFQIDVAGFDGQLDPGQPPASIIPFAWNRAPEGDVIMPEDLDLVHPEYGVHENFDVRQFDGLEDAGYPQRLNAILVNFALGISDRHGQNQMGATIDGRPMVVPIDMGWAGRYQPNDIFDYIHGYWAEENLDTGLEFFDHLEVHLYSLDASERARQASALTDTLDSTIERIGKIISGGEDAFIERVMSTLDVDSIDPDVAQQIRDEASQKYSLIKLGLRKIRAQRDDLVKKWSIQ